MFSVIVMVVVVIAAVHLVHRDAYKRGHKLGVAEGRCQVLKDELARTAILEKRFNDRIDQIE